MDKTEIETIGGIMCVKVLGGDCTNCDVIDGYPDEHNVCDKCAQDACDGKFYHYRRAIPAEITQSEDKN